MNEHIDTNPMGYTAEIPLHKDNLLYQHVREFFPELLFCYEYPNVGDLMVCKVVKYPYSITPTPSPRYTHIGGGIIYKGIVTPIDVMRIRRRNLVKAWLFINKDKVKDWLTFYKL